MSGSFVRADVLKEKAHAILEEANRRCEETINLTVLDGADVAYILRFPSKHVVSVNLTVGTRLPAFCTAPGRVLLAHMDRSEVDLVLAKSDLAKRTELTETDPRRLPGDLVSGPAAGLRAEQPGSVCRRHLSRRTHLRRKGRCRSRSQYRGAIPSLVGRKGKAPTHSDREGRRQGRLEGARLAGLSPELSRYVLHKRRAACLTAALLGCES